jgi:hypothetical protein
MRRAELFSTPEQDLPCLLVQDPADALVSIMIRFSDSNE